MGILSPKQWNPSKDTKLNYLYKKIVSELANWNLLQTFFHNKTQFI